MSVAVRIKGLGSGVRGDGMGAWIGVREPMLLLLLLLLLTRDANCCHHLAAAACCAASCS